MGKASTTRTIRTVADLAALSDAELSACLRALRDAIQARKRVHAAAIASGSVPSDSPLGFTEYTWKPNPESESKWNQDYPPTTPVRELPIRTRARFQLEDMRILALEDLSTISERELMCCKDMGATTVTRLRELLQSNGMDFAQPEDPEVAEYQRNRALRTLGGDELLKARAGLPDDAPITRLGLHPQTVERAKRAGWQKVGELRAAALRQLAVGFGKAGIKEVVLALNDTGEGLRCRPQPYELWRFGVLELDELTKPDADDTPVAQLRPWVGAVVEKLQEAGVETLGELRAAAKEGPLRRMRGVGANGQDRLLEFLGEPRFHSARKSAGGIKAPNSVFALGLDKLD